MPTETRFLWEGSRLLAEFNGDRTQVYAYSDQNSYAPLARIDGNGDNSQLYYFHTRLNGQPEAMTDSEGNERWRGKPDGWGKVKGETPEREIKSGGPQNLRMQGQYLYRETGLHYNLHRYYDPDSGRFTQHDPIGLAGGLNLYQYAPNSLGWIDPLGLCKKSVDTPYGAANQSNSLPALAARKKVENGSMLYRIGTTGKSETTRAQFWALEHPSSIGYAGRYGIPQGNIDRSDFIMTAKLKPGADFVTRSAPGVGGNFGGGIEVVVPPNYVDIITFSKYSLWKIIFIKM